MFVAVIHNNSLGNCIAVQSFDEGDSIIIEYAKGRLNRDLTEEEIEDIQETHEFHDFSDSDNHTSFCLGMMLNG